MNRDWSASEAGPVIAFLPELDRRPAHVEVGGYLALQPGLHGFVEALYDCGLALSFDWGAWARTPEGSELVQGRGVASADLEAVRKALTAHVRVDRFMEGHLIVAVESGQVAALVRRLLELAAAERSNVG